MDEREYEICYKSLKFQENKNDPFSTAQVRRKCLALNYFASVENGQDNDVTLNLLRDGLRAYSDIVDNQNGVNNYTDSILALLGTDKLETPKTWDSGLDDFDLEEVLEPLPCADPAAKYKCPSDDVEEHWLKKLRECVINGEKKDYTKEVETKDHVQVNVNLEPKPYTSYTTCKRPYNSVFHESKSIEQTDNWKNRQPCPLSTSMSVTHDENHTEDTKWKRISFRTAREELHHQNMKKNKNSQGPTINSGNSGTYSYAPIKKSLGTRKCGGVFGKFQPPSRPKENQSSDSLTRAPVRETEFQGEGEEEVDERLKNIDPKMIELIKNEIMECGTKITWDDIAGLELAKNTIQEIVVWPMLRPDIFTGLRRPAKGILLFGPPGTGKTLIGKCIASQSCSTFFSISASSLTSKWIGDGEKMVRALFAVARCHQPAVVFIDEIDSLLSQRSDTEHESSRRLKTEFLVQLDGAGTAEDDRILIIGATNRPQELDEAARRRLVKRLYVPLPDEKARGQIVKNLISKERHNLTEDEIREISILCKGYSGADMKNLCQEASLGPIRSIPPMAISRINPEDVRPLNKSDFMSALNRIKSSVSEKDLDIYVKWDKQYGCGSGGL